jgi:hypothetical protein
MDEERVLPDQTDIVKEGEIVVIGLFASVHAPAKSSEACGRSPSGSEAGRKRSLSRSRRDWSFDRPLKLCHARHRGAEQLARLPESKQIFCLSCLLCTLHKATGQGVVRIVKATMRAAWYTERLGQSMFAFG